MISLHLRTRATTFIRSYLGVIERDDFTRSVHSINIPTLILHGEDDISLKSSHGRKLHQLIPLSYFAVITDAGHQAAEENPEHTNFHIENFIKECERVRNLTKEEMDEIVVQRRKEKEEQEREVLEERNAGAEADESTVEDSKSKTQAKPTDQ